MKNKTTEETLRKLGSKTRVTKKHKRRLGSTHSLADELFTLLLLSYLRLLSHLRARGVNKHVPHCHGPAGLR